MVVSERRVERVVRVDWILRLMGANKGGEG